MRIPNTSQVCVIGNVQVTTQAMRALLAEGVTVSFFSSGGWFMGRTVTHDSKNAELKAAQYAAHLDERWRLRLARGLVDNKIANQRTLLRRNASDLDETTLFELKQLRAKAREQSSRGSLLGIEGTAARVYFGSFQKMLKGSAIEDGLTFERRSRRPPLDPLNALLSFGYALLSKELTLACAAVGLDPMLGFFHEPRFGRPALALDLMEPFRPIIADSVVISAVNNNELGASDFIRSPIGCALKPRARRAFIAAYERRMRHEIKHPMFGYKISYRRTLEVQARLLGRHLLGEIPDYPEFRTR